MRISDWSSDVCSSDLVLPGQVVAAGDVEPGQQSVGERVVGAMTGHGASSPGSDGSSIVTSTPSSCAPEISRRGVDRWPDSGGRGEPLEARQSVVWGRGVSVSVDQGGGRISEKKQTKGK